MSAQTSSNFYADTAYRRAQKLYFLAVQSEEYLEEAEKAFQSLISRYGRQDPLLMYLHGLTALKARYALNPLKKRDYFYEAVRQMDAIVQKTPNDVEIRFLRGSFYYYLPFFLGKRAQAEEDLRTLTLLLLKNVDTYRKRYSYEALKAIIGFLEQSRWIEDEKIKKIKEIYTIF
ncbi:MAG: hypothetical protein RMK19_00730 [Bacteroidia bacterium]|nr:hypothetical protein [Bacteroidia bacterium]MDW8014518.1 hypothetical protein [Bacteroidia bacterium]